MNVERPPTSAVIVAAPLLDTSPASSAGAMLTTTPGRPDAESENHPRPGESKS